MPACSPPPPGTTFLLPQKPYPLPIPPPHLTPSYPRWRFVQRLASATISAFSTQQMLYAIGLGASRVLPTAAALNWVLKDGLGRLGKLMAREWKE